MSPTAAGTSAKAIRTNILVLYAATSASSVLASSFGSSHPPTMRSTIANTTMTTDHAIAPSLLFSGSRTRNTTAPKINSAKRSARETSRSDFSALTRWPSISPPVASIQPEATVET